MIKLENGRVVIARSQDFLQWCAWRSWLHVQTGRQVFLEKLAVWGEWPPETQAMADTVIGKIRELRDADFMPAAVPQPWQPWDTAKRLDLQRRHKEDFFWNPALPKSRCRLLTVRVVTDTDRELKDWMDAKAERLPPLEKGESFESYTRRVGGRGRAPVFDDEPSASGQPGVTRPLSPEQLAEISRVRAEALARRLDEFNEA